MERSEVELAAAPVAALGVVLRESAVSWRFTKYGSFGIERTWILVSDLRRNHCGMGLPDEDAQPALVGGTDRQGYAPVPALGLRELLLDAESLLGRLFTQNENAWNVADKEPAHHVDRRPEVGDAEGEGGSGVARLTSFIT
jgi:hypothetical protein